MFGPDARLQAIADAPLCEHGNVYRHIVTPDIRTEFGGTLIEFCFGAPELAGLLDSLTEDES